MKAGKSQRPLLHRLEDKLCFDPTRPAASNAELVKKIVNVCDRYGRHHATPAEARQILGLRPR